MNKQWKDIEYPLNIGLILTEHNLVNYINLFWQDVMSSIKDNQHVLLIIRVKFENNQIVSLSNMQTINLSSKDILIEFIKDKLNLSNENYKITPVISVRISYGNIEGEYKYSLDLSKRNNKNIKYQVYYRNELPIAMVPEDYGAILSKLDNNYTITVNRGKHNALINLTVKNIGNQTINHIRYIKNNKLLFSWTDTILSLEEKKFIRKIGKSIIHYEDGEISLYTTIKKTSPMVPKNLSKFKPLLAKLGYPRFAIKNKILNFTSNINLARLTKANYIIIV
jgi:hypothetical protein